MPSSTSMPGSARTLQSALGRFEAQLGALLRRLLTLPEPWVRRFAGPAVRNDRGDVLDLPTQAMLAAARRLRLPGLEELPPEPGRRNMDRQSRLAAGRGPRLPFVEDTALAGSRGAIGARVYGTPATHPSGALVFFHGGGFVLGSLASHDALCRILAAEAGVVVVSVDYALAPEHPFPRAVEDAVAAFEAVRDRAADFGVTPRRVAVGGDSAGGNLAAVVARQARTRAGAPPLAQLLLYPGLDMTRSLPSHLRFARGFFLENRTMDWFLDRYLPRQEDRTDLRASPLLATDAEELPPSLVLSAGFDPLRDEGEAYAVKLRDAGDHVEERRAPTMVHGFLNMGALSPTAERERLACAHAFGRLVQG
jgi:acetyl esterase